MTFSRKYRSSRKRPARISAVSSLFVAASTRTSTRTPDVPPTGSTTCSCSTRSTFACVFRLMSPISSRKIVPAVGHLELPAPVADRAGERPLHVAEQLALDQLLGDRRAVHLDEGAGPPPAERVDRPGDQFLAGAVLAVDQHAAVGRRGHRHLLAQLAHRVALAHHLQVTVHAGAQRAVLGLEPALPQRVAHDEHRLLERQRLLDEVERARA